MQMPLCLGDPCPARILKVEEKKRVETRGRTRRRRRRRCSCRCTQLYRNINIIRAIGRVQKPRVDNNRGSRSRRGADPQRAFLCHIINVQVPYL